MKLTKRYVDAIKAPDTGNLLFFDDEISGFGVRVWPSGTKSFIYQDRIKGKKRRITLGRYGSITVEQARRHAQKLAGEIAGGGDPIEEKHRNSLESVTLADAFREYLSKRDLKQTTRRDIDRAMKSFADWMKKPIIGINRDMVSHRHKKLGASSPARANLAMRYLRAILNFASEEFAYPDGRPLLIDNPVKRLSATRAWFRIDRRRVYLKPHEIKPWMKAVLQLAEVPDREPGKGWELPKLRHGALSRDFLILLLFTGLRRTEAMDLKWDAVDLVDRTITIIDPKNRETHILPLSNYLVDMLSFRLSISGNIYVFSDVDGTRLSNIRYALQRVEKMSGIYVSAHDLRRTFATVAESLDIPAYAVKRLLNHKNTGDVTAGYIQITPERLRVPMEKITAQLLTLAGLVETGKILQFDQLRAVK